MTVLLQWSTPLANFSGRRLAAIAIGILITTVAGAESLRFQSAVLNNDKLQKEYVPYKLALAKAFGTDFLRGHQPVFERRRICEWDGQPHECGYLALGGPPLTPQERDLVSRVLADPCASIDMPAAAAVYRFVGSDEAQRKKLLSKYSELKSLCGKGFLIGGAVRPAVNPPPKREANEGAAVVSAFDVLIVQPATNRR